MHPDDALSPIPVYERERVDSPRRDGIQGEFKNQEAKNKPRAEIVLLVSWLLNQLCLPLN